MRARFFCFFRGRAGVMLVVMAVGLALAIGCSEDRNRFFDANSRSDPQLDTECCALTNGGFANGLAGWTDESSGPGLECGGVEEIPIDGRPDVLHLDSRTCGNYYLFFTQTVAVCDVVGAEIAWDWKLAEIHRPYGLAAVWFEFLDGSGARKALYFVRRHTGDFAAYDCASVVAEIVGNGMTVECEEAIGTSFDWERHTVSFTQGFFENLQGPGVDPSEIDSIKIWVQSYNNAGAGVDAYFDNFELTCDGGGLALDIKPQSCPNPLNPRSRGVLPVAILGSATQDVHDVDVSSLLLEGVAPLKSGIEDVSTPLVGGDDCNCTVDGADGLDDLTLKFRTQDIVSALGSLSPGEQRTLTLTGNLLDGTPFELTDCVHVVPIEPSDPECIDLVLESNPMHLGDTTNSKWVPCGATASPVGTCRTYSFSLASGASACSLRVRTSGNQPGTAIVIVDGDTLGIAHQDTVPGDCLYTESSFALPGVTGGAHTVTVCATVFEFGHGSEYDDFIFTDLIVAGEFTASTGIVAEGRMKEVSP